MGIRYTQATESDGLYYFDEKAARRACEFFPRYLTLFEGEWAGEPFELFGMQTTILREIFGWKRVADGTRLYRVAYVWIPRKNTKSTTAAGLALLLLFGDAEPGAQVYCLASTEDQARIVFNFAGNLVTASPELAARTTVFKSAIWLDEINGKIEPLTGKAQGKHGLNASGIVGDEVHEWPSDELYTFVHQSEGTRRQPLDFLISTAGKTGTTGHEHYKFCEAVLAREIDAPDVFVYIASADPVKDEKDPNYWKSDEAIIEANPGLGVTVKLDFLRSEIKKAEGNKKKINDIKRYYLNLWVDQASVWLDMSKYDLCDENDPFEPELQQNVSVPTIFRGNSRKWQDFRNRLAGRRCFVGVDMSSNQDLTAVVYVFPPDEDDPNWYVYPQFFLPEGLNREQWLKDRTKRDRFDYAAAVEFGALHLTEGEVIDHDAIEANIVEHSDVFVIEKVALDRWNALSIAVKLQKHGFDVSFFSQGIAAMSAPAKFLERLILQGRFRHGGHPVLRYNARVIAVTVDGNENIKPVKDHSTGRIDGIIAAIMAIGISDEMVDDDIFDAYDDNQRVKSLDDID